jgi:hypothetical protein
MQTQACKYVSAEADSGSGTYFLPTLVANGRVLWYRQLHTRHRSTNTQRAVAAAELRSCLSRVLAFFSQIQIKKTNKTPTALHDFSRERLFIRGINIQSKKHIDRAKNGRARSGCTAAEAVRDPACPGVFGTGRGISAADASSDVAGGSARECVHGATKPAHAGEEHSAGSKTRGIARGRQRGKGPRCGHFWRNRLHWSPGLQVHGGKLQGLCGTMGYSSAEFHEGVAASGRNQRPG